MPYITKDRREFLEENAGKEIDDPITVGDLNYCISRSILSYIEDHGLSYKTLNDVAGVLSLVDFEIKRRLVAAYENRKISENGDIDGFDISTYPTKPASSGT